MLIRTQTSPDNHDLARLGEYGTRMAAGDYDAILRMRDGRVVEHRGGPHCMYGIGLVRTTGPGPHAAAPRTA